MRLLWSLPKAAPAILRHIIAYAELAGQDLERAHGDFIARLRASVIFGVSMLFVILSACLLVVALTWDTPNRVAAILWMGGGFLVVAVVAGVYRSNVIGAQPGFLGQVRHEWSEDRKILEKIMSNQDRS